MSKKLDKIDYNQEFYFMGDTRNNLFWTEYDSTNLYDDYIFSKKTLKEFTDILNDNELPFELDTYGKQADGSYITKLYTSKLGINFLKLTIGDFNEYI